MTIDVGGTIPTHKNSRITYDEWFLREVKKGIAAANSGQLIDHDEVKTLLDQRYSG